MKTLSEAHKILIAVEDSQYSEHAADYGFELAKKLGADVALVHVNDIPVATPYIPDPILNEPPVLVPELIQIQEDAGKKLLDRISDKYIEQTTIYTFNKVGNTRDEILSTAEEWNADMIILGTHGRTGFDHFISGSVAEKVVRKAKCPVLIIPNKEYGQH
jgi:nucleotide-binding universal stress UspA family protein